MLSWVTLKHDLDINECVMMDSLTFLMLEYYLIVEFQEKWDFYAHQWQYWCMQQLDNFIHIKWLHKLAMFHIP